MVLSGDAIPQIEEEVTSLIDAAVARRQEHVLHMCRPVLRFIQILMGKKEGMPDDESDPTSAMDAQDDMGVDFFHFGQTLTAYIFNDYNAAAKEAREIKHAVLSLYGHPSMSCLLTFRSLALLAVCNQYRGRARRNILSTVAKTIKQLEQFCLYTPENCLAKTNLLQAELAAVTGKDGLARCKYMGAIAVAAEVDDLMLRAIAYERVARFLQQRGDESDANRYFRNAHSAYQDWGATAKVKQMQKEMPDLLSLDVSPTS